MRTGTTALILFSVNISEDKGYEYDVNTEVRLRLLAHMFAGHERQNTIPAYYRGYSGWQ